MSEHATSEEIENEIEETRTGIGRTLDGLQRRLSPDSLIGDTLRSARVGEALRSVGSDSAELARKIGRAASDHPLPLILTGAGLTWLAIAGLRGRKANGHGTRDRLGSPGIPAAGEYDDYPAQAMGERAYASGLNDMERTSMGNTGNWIDAGDVEDYAIADTGSSEGLAGKAKSTLGEARAKASELSGQAAGSAKAASEAITGRVKQVAEAVKRTGSTAFERTSGAAHQVTDVIREAPERLGSIRHSAGDFVRANPIIAGSIAVALGAGLALLIPASRREQEMLGEASDRVKTQVRGAVGETLQQAKSAAQSAAAVAVESARREVSPDRPEGETSATTGGDTADVGDEAMVREDPAVTERIRMAALSRSPLISVPEGNDPTIGR